MYEENVFRVYLTCVLCRSGATMAFLDVSKRALVAAVVCHSCNSSNEHQNKSAEDYYCDYGIETAYVESTLPFFEARLKHGKAVQVKMLRENRALVTSISVFVEGAGKGFIFHDLKYDDNRMYEIPINLHSKFFGLM